MIEKWLPRAPKATAPSVGIYPTSWPEYPIWISGKRSLNLDYINRIMIMNFDKLLHLEITQNKSYLFVTGQMSNNKYRNTTFPENITISKQYV